jgi:hypothetical protein
MISAKRGWMQITRKKGRELGGGKILMQGMPAKYDERPTVGCCPPHWK